MSFISFVLALPFFIVGFVFQWAWDMFTRGRAAYEVVTGE